jgi:hypothetical protein
MNVEAIESVSESWADLQGRAVNGVFPLHRLLGSTDHSGVFLTESAKRKSSEIALKLVPVSSTLAELQLSRWLTAAGLVHPHLLRIFEAGRCQLEGQHYLYAAMEYADQNLAQLLVRRALTQDEAREMLAPTLSALTFLHDRQFVQGRLKPSNLLVVGDQLKLASDTIRPVNEASAGDGAFSVYDPPEARDETCSASSDVWALGVTLCEALTRRQPAGLQDGRGNVQLPSDLAPAFREVVARCLSRRTFDRPKVSELEGWLSGKQIRLAPAPASASTSAAAPAPVRAEQRAPVTQRESVASQPAALQVAVLPPSVPQPPRAAPQPVAPQPSVQQSTAVRSAARVKAVPKKAAVDETAAQAAAAQVAKALAAEEAMSYSPSRGATPESSGKSAERRVTRMSDGTAAARPSKRLVLPAVGAVVLLALTWVGMHMLRTQQAPPAADAAGEADVQASGQSQTADLQTPGPTTSAFVDESSQLPVSYSDSSTSSTSATRSADTDFETAGDTSASGSGSAIHEEFPDVPRRARQTIRGHVKVSVRLIVDQDGTVFAALADNRGPSRYFERLAIDAAKKWTFPPADTEAQRLMLLRFDFTRDGVTAHANALE